MGLGNRLQSGIRATVVERGCLVAVWLRHKNSQFKGGLGAGTSVAISFSSCDALNLEQSSSSNQANAEIEEII
jgi:hypothetical protein